MDQPLAVFPAIFAAPRIVAVEGMSASLVPTPSCGARPIRRGIQHARRRRARTADRAAKPETAGALDEERATFLETRLERRQIDDGRVDFDLAEIRIGRRRQREVRRDAVARVEAGGGVHVVLLDEGVRRFRLERALAQHVRQQLELASGAKATQAGQVAECGHAALLRLRREREHRQFLPPIDHPFDLQAPDLLVGRGKTELAERNAHLGGPAVGVDRRRGIPHRVPCQVALAAAGKRVVAAHARRVDLEPGRSAAIVVTVEADAEPIGRRAGHVAAAQPRRHPAPVVHPRRDVHRFVVVGDPDLGGFAGRFSFVRIALREQRDHRCAVPGRVVEPSVDGRSGRGPDGRGARRDTGIGRARPWPGTAPGSADWAIANPGRRTATSAARGPTMMELRGMTSRRV